MLESAASHHQAMKIILAATVITVLAGIVFFTRNLHNDAWITPDTYINDDYTKRGNLLMAHRYYQRAIAAYAKASRGGMSPAALAGIGRAYRALGFLRRAETAFRKVIERDPEAAYGYSWLADTVCKLGSCERSIPLYERALKIEPWNGYHYRGMGQAFLAENVYTRAIPALKDALRLLPLGSEDYGEAFHLLSAACREASRLEIFDGKASPLADALAADKSASSILTQAELWFRLDAFERSARLYARALASEPRNGYALKGLAWSRYRIGEKRKAAKTFREALKNLPRKSIDYEDASRGLSLATADLVDQGQGEARRPKSPL